MADKHTPGPWETNGLRIWAKVLYSDSKALELATMSHFVPSTEREATARVMATAPELLDVLMLVEERFGAHCADPLPLDLCELIVAALSKARGEQV